MQTNHAGALRGLSIAVIIISAIAIVGCLICVVFIGVGGSYLANVSPETWEYYLYDGDYYDYAYGYDYYGVDGSDMAAIMALLIAFGGVALGAAMLFTVPALIAGILGLRNHSNPAKLGLVFGWSLAGAITALLSGNMVTMVLLIIMCVFSYKDKQLAATQPVVIAQPVAPVQPIASAASAAQLATDVPVAPEVAQPAETVEAVAVEIGTPITESTEPAAEPSALAQEEALEAAEAAKSE